MPDHADGNRTQRIPNPVRADSEPNRAQTELQPASRQKPEPGTKPQAGSFEQNEPDENPQAEMMRQDALCPTNSKRAKENNDCAETSNEPNPQVEMLQQDARCTTDSKRKDNERG